MIGKRGYKKVMDEKIEPVLTEAPVNCVKVHFSTPSYTWGLLLN